MGFGLFEGRFTESVVSALQAFAEESAHIPPLLEQEHNHPSHFPPFALETFSTQLIWLAIFFGLLYLFVARVATPRMGGVVNRRSEWIDEQRLASETAREKAEKLTQSYEIALNDARTQAQKVLKDTHELVTTESLERRKLYDHDSKEKLKMAESRVHSVKESTLKALVSSSGEVAALIVQRLTGLTPTDSQVARVTSENKSS